MDRQTERVKISEVCQFNNKNYLKSNFFEKRIDKPSSNRSHAAWMKFTVHLQKVFFWGG